jgi:murein DD-endopeptidase MepM/ murein hydrolase activator NlpD
MARLARRFTLTTLAATVVACGEDPAGLRTLPGVNITVTPASLTLPVGGSAALTATVRDLEGRLLEREVTWSSSAPEVVAVSPSGFVTARGIGVATIGAYADQGVGFARAVVQMNFRLPVGLEGTTLRAETGTATALCPSGEGGLRPDGGRECSHAGISRYSLDFSAPPRPFGDTEQVFAAADGVVADVCLQPPPEVTCGPNGPFVFIDHGSGFTAFYSHIDPETVGLRRKTPVLQGTHVARMGAGAAGEEPWVHFEVRYNNQDPGENPVLDNLVVDGRKLTDYRVAR